MNSRLRDAPQCIPFLMKPMKLLAILSLLISLPRSLLAEEPLAVGESAPAPTVTTGAGESLDLSEVYAKGPTLVYFYPKSFTPGCTEQACNLRDNFDAVRSAGITVIGVSRDDVATQAKFRAEEKLPFTLVADEKGALGDAFQVGSYGGAVYKRQSFLVVDGKIAWRDLAASPDSQSADAIQALGMVKARNGE